MSNSTSSSSSNPSSSSKVVREQRYFSEDFRKARVREYEEGLARVSEISRTYGVSQRSVYKWIEKYSLHYQKSIIKVVEEKSETRKRQALEKQVAELERLVGQKEAHIAYLGKIMDLAEEQFGIDWEKNFGILPYSGFKDISKKSE